MTGRTILLSAENGPVLAADDTGLVMRLSDRVVADIARRMGQAPGTAKGEALPQGDPVAAAPVTLDAAILGDIDAWDAMRDGDWLRFTARLPGAEGVRRYRRHISGPALLAETPGPVLGLFSLSGGRRFNAPSALPEFPYHLANISPQEDEGEAPRLFEALHHSGINAYTACTLLRHRHDAFRALPLFATAAALLPPGPLGSGTDLDMLRPSLDRFAALAGALGKSARIAAIAVEIGPDHLADGMDARGFHAAGLALLDGISATVDQAGLAPPRILLTLDCGAWWGTQAARARIAAEGFALLALRPGGHDLCVVGATAALTQDRLGQPTADAILAQSAVEAQALEARMAREAWTAPLMCLAERDGPRALRAVFKAGAALILDPDDPMQAGPAAGFAITGADAAPGIAGVEIHPQDDRAIRITLDGDLPDSGEWRLDYAIPEAPGAGRPGWNGALRDDWQAVSGDGRTHYRWAVPASQVIR
ncbi:hypothetical protein SAMN05421538_101570 [Paracoccus isoporae]|uniref:Uncharacterized protein n=1 Tax=Paracoccus isoporae TaxID=591205 RepID=A0A1G6UKJ4_9RHOB|nr:hypothetical protein [Paracoccus isoporae]SDD41764.1 hypothetical protein SAMN05421538_101570 [Paracoccus isoporae]